MEVKWGDVIVCKEVVFGKPVENLEMTGLSDDKKEIARLRKGIQDYLDGNYDNPRKYRAQGPQTKCPHGRNYWDACDSCIDEHFMKLVAP